MSNDEIIRSWKSEEENTPTAPESQKQTKKGSTPLNPAGEQELSDADLEHVEGGAAHLAGSCMVTSC